jgi:hypothetical protein
MRNALLPGSEKRVRTILGNSSDPLFDIGSGKRVRTILGNSSDPLFDTKDRRGIDCGNRIAGIGLKAI